MIDASALMVSSLIGAVVGTLASGIVNMLLLAPIKKRLEQADELKATLRKLADERVAKLEQNAAHYVTKADCLRAHDSQTEMTAEITNKQQAVALKLAEVATQTDRAIDWLQSIANQVIAAREKIAATVARVEDLDKKISEVLR